MKVRKIDDNGDWTFGQSKANYIDGAEAIRQNVATNIKMFTDDWFLDVDKNIDWFSILGNKNNKEIISNEVDRVTRETFGVVNVISIEVDVKNTDEGNRTAKIILKFTTIYDDILESEIII